jgi:hypothetical protein
MVLNRLLFYSHSEDETVLEKNSYYELREVHQNEAVIYKYCVFNKRGKKVLESIEKTVRPEFRFVGDNIIEINRYFGSGYYLVQYYDVQSDLLSPVFDSPLLMDNRKIVCINIGEEKYELVVSNVFDELSSNVRFDLAQILDLPVDEVIGAIEDVKLEQSIKIRYYPDRSERLITKTIPLSPDYQ